MTLHLLGASPSDRATFESCRSTLTEQDTLLLLEEGCYWALPHHRQELSRIPARVVVLGPDSLARGIATEGLKTVDDAEFVVLATEHARTVSWY